MAVAVVALGRCVYVAFISRIVGERSSVSLSGVVVPVLLLVFYLLSVTSNSFIIEVKNNVCVNYFSISLLSLLSPRSLVY